jgi:hypothetical protein
MTPTGSAISVMPVISSWLMTPTVFWLMIEFVTCSHANMFFTALSSNRPRRSLRRPSWRVRREVQGRDRRLADDVVDLLLSEGCVLCERFLCAFDQSIDRGGHGVLLPGADAVSASSLSGSEGSRACLDPQYAHVV